MPSQQVEVESTKSTLTDATDRREDTHVPRASMPANRRKRDKPECKRKLCTTPPVEVWGAWTKGGDDVEDKAKRQANSECEAYLWDQTFPSNRKQAGADSGAGQAQGSRFVASLLLDERHQLESLGARNFGELADSRGDCIEFVGLGCQSFVSDHRILLQLPSFLEPGFSGSQLATSARIRVFGSAWTLWTFVVWPLCACITGKSASLSDKTLLLPRKARSELSSCVSRFSKSFLFGEACNSRLGRSYRTAESLQRFTEEVLVSVVPVDRDAAVLQLLTIGPLQKPWSMWNSYTGRKSCASKRFAVRERFARIWSNFAASAMRRTSTA